MRHPQPRGDSLQHTAHRALELHRISSTTTLINHAASGLLQERRRDIPVAALAVLPLPSTRATPLLQTGWHPLKQIVEAPLATELAHGKARLIRWPASCAKARTRMIALWPQ